MPWRKKLSKLKIKEFRPPLLRKFVRIFRRVLLRSSRVCKWTVRARYHYKMITGSPLNALNLWLTAKHIAIANMSFNCVINAFLSFSDYFKLGACRQNISILCFQQLTELNDMLTKHILSTVKFGRSGSGNTWLTWKDKRRKFIKICHIYVPVIIIIIKWLIIYFYSMKYDRNWIIDFVLLLIIQFYFSSFHLHFVGMYILQNKIVDFYCVTSDF